MTEPALLSLADTLVVTLVTSNVSPLGVDQIVTNVCLVTMATTAALIVLIRPSIVVMLTAVKFALVTGVAKFAQDVLLSLPVLTVTNVSLLGAE